MAGTGMTIYRNNTTETLSLGDITLAPNATVDTSEHGTKVLSNIKYFYENNKLTVTSGTPDFTAVTVSEGGVIQYTAAQWITLNPVLPLNVFGLDTTTKTIKMGDGVHTYSALSTYGGTGGEGTPSTAFNFTDIDCSEYPEYPECVVYAQYRVSVDGKIGGESGITVRANDLIIPLEANLGGTQDEVGTKWGVYHTHSNYLDIESLDLASTDYVLNWGRSYVSTTMDIASNATLANIPGLIQLGILADKAYSVRVVLHIANTVNNGVKVAFATPDTLTVSNITGYAESFTSTGAIVAHTDLSTLTTELCAATAVVKRIEIVMSFLASTEGTLRVQAAQNTSHADTLSILTGSEMCIDLLQA